MTRDSRDRSCQAESPLIEPSTCALRGVDETSPNAHSLGKTVATDSPSTAPASDTAAVLPALPDSHVAVSSTPGASSDCDAEKQPVGVHDFLTEAPDYHAATREMFEKASGVADEVDRRQRMGEVHRRVHGFATTAELAGLGITARVASALATLLKKFCENPRTITPSTINTICKALICLERLCVPGIEQQLAAQTPVQMLVVEDEPLAKRAVMGTLERAFDKPESASNGSTALALVSEKTYDVIFTDVQMPVMDGFELCTLIRGSGPNSGTPVVFISGLNDAASRSRGYQCGGNDFIKKPFLPIEMTVKALTFAWEGRLRQIEANAASGTPADLV